MDPGPADVGGVGGAQPRERRRLVKSRAGVRWEREADLPAGAAGDRWVFSNEVVRPMLAAGELSSRAWVVLFLLMHQASDQVEDVWMDRGWITRQLGWSTRTVDRYLTELRRLGVLEWAQSGGSDQRRGRTPNLYRLCVPKHRAAEWRKAREQAAAVRAQSVRQRYRKRPRWAPEESEGPGGEPRRFWREVDDARSLVVDLYRSGTTVGDIDGQVRGAFASRPAVLMAALAELQRLRVGG